LGILVHAVPSVISVDGVHVESARARRSSCHRNQFRSKQQDADRFLAQFSPSFKVLFDPSGAEALRWQVHGMPTSVLIDKSGAVRFTHTGFSLNERSQYEHQINTLLTEKRGRQ
jgi:hypothetical protein